jgi:hypothetical protein
MFPLVLLAGLGFLLWRTVAGIEDAAEPLALGADEPITAEPAGPQLRPQPQMAPRQAAFAGADESELGDAPCGCHPHARHGGRR